MKTVAGIGTVILLIIIMLINIDEFFSGCDVDDLE